MFSHLIRKHRFQFGLHSDRCMHQDIRFLLNKQQVYHTQEQHQPRFRQNLVPRGTE